MYDFRFSLNTFCRFNLKQRSEKTDLLQVLSFVLIFKVYVLVLPTNEKKVNTLYKAGNING